jgi:hypothetical protein
MRRRARDFTVPPPKRQVPGSPAPPRRPANSLFNQGVPASPAVHAPQSASTVKDDEGDESDALFEHDQALHTLPSAGQ